MAIKAALSKPYAKLVVRKIKKWAANPHKTQQKVFKELIASGSQTQFGKDHGFGYIRSYEDYKKAVPLRDYEAIRPYIEKALQGDQDVLWKGKPIYWCKTSGTTSGSKYIPISKESISNHINSAKEALLSYIAETGKAQFVNGKMIFLQGSPVLEEKKGVQLGRLSGIVAHHVPGYLQKNRMPTYKTNCIEDWETKVDTIVEETLAENMTLISGIPSWVQMYFEKLLESSGKKTIQEIFPNFSLFVYGGVNFEPYRPIFKKLIGKEIPSIETYPASEGFIAYQDSQKEPGLLLNLNKGIFYEFVPADEIASENPTRLELKDVKKAVNYAIVLSTNAGLWSYVIGDTVKFVSTSPYRIVVTGRTKHFISAFGEHVIAEEVESCMKEVLNKHNIAVTEFHVAPFIENKNGLPYHEWFIEFSDQPVEIEIFSKDLDKLLQSKNTYYKDLLEGKILQPLKITSIQKGGFTSFMKSRGKLGGQNKIPRLANDRAYAEELIKFAVSE